MGLLVAASAQDSVKFSVPGVSPAAQPAAPAAAPAKAKFTEAQVVEAYGWYMGAQMGLHQLEFTKEQVEAMARGMIGAATGGQPSFDPKEIGPDVQAFLAAKNDVYMMKMKYQNLADGTAFFKKLKEENKNVVEQPDGLRYEILKPGTGPLPKPGQVLTIHYTGTFINGEPFDSSLQPRQPGAPVEPVNLLLQPASAANPNGMIPGMFEGLQKVGAGGKLKLYIPPSLAYGDEGSQAIPPGATLVFEVEMLGVKDAPAEPAAPAAK